MGNRTRTNSAVNHLGRRRKRRRRLPPTGEPETGVAVHAAAAIHPNGDGYGFRPADWTLMTMKPQQLVVVVLVFGVVVFVIDTFVSVPKRRRRYAAIIIAVAAAVMFVILVVAVSTIMKIIIIPILLHGPFQEDETAAERL